MGLENSTEKFQKISENSRSTDLNTLSCNTNDPEIKVSVKNIKSDKYLLQFQNNNPSQSRTIKISIEHDSIKFSNKLIYYARDLSNGRAYRWSGKTNDVFLDKGQTKLQLLVELKN